MRNLLASPLASEFDLRVFETGSRGTESPARDEPALAMMARLLVSPFALAAAIVRHRPDVVHLNTSVTTKGFWREVVHLVVCRMLGCRVLYQIHGGSLDELTAPRGMRALVRMVYRWPDAFVLLASSEMAAFQALGGLRRLTIIPNAVDTAAFRAGGTRVHSGEVKRLAYLGRLNGNKGEKECIEAVGLLRDAPGAAVELRLAGSGPARAELEALVGRLGLGDRVHFLGALHGEDKVRFLRESDVLVLASYHAEGLPYVVLESLAAGTPVIATRAGGIPDVMRVPDHGRFVAPRDPAAIASAVREIAAAPDALRAMSVSCGEWAERELGLARLALRFGALYRELGAVRGPR
jgi:glycosyltransferase involved in cell wall biosynthesis